MSDLLKNKQILALFISSFAVLFTGMGLLPLLPLLAGSYNANNSTTGFYLASIYAANSLGPVLTGFLITRFTTKTSFVIGALIGLPALIGLGLARNFLLIVLWTSLLWLSGGVVMSLVSILTGQSTEASNQGKAFSLMALVGPLGSLAGGAMVGQVVAWQGYSVMFMMLAGIWMVIPLIGWLFLKVSPRDMARTSLINAASQAKPAVRLGPIFTRAVAVTFVGVMAVNLSRFGASLSMQSLDYTPEVVSRIAMLSGLVAVPATMAAGVLSDRLGRKHVLFTGYLFAMSGALILTDASQFWQFSLASVLLMLAFSINGAMTQAITSEIVPAEVVSRGLSWLNTLSAAANIVCFAIGGLLYDWLGMPVVFLISAVLVLASGTGLESLVQTPKHAAGLEECIEA